jgi:YgiT-type zinc finger domain-containing protein
MICQVCEKGKLSKKTVSYEIYGTKIGDFPANVCSKCNEQWFDEATALKIEKLEKEKGLFGISKKSKISYSGNSLIVRIPKEIARFMKIKKAKEISIYPQGKDKLVIEM